MWPFRRSQTLPDAPDRHQVTLDLIESVAALRGQVRALEAEWDDMRTQIRKGYQRMEKAHERANPEKEPKAEDESQHEISWPPAGPASGFMDKLKKSGLAS